MAHKSLLCAVATMARQDGFTEEPLLGTGDIQSLADPGNSFEIIRKMRILPVELSDFIAFVLPGLIPALPLAATVMPLGEIVKNLLKLIA